MAPDPLPKYVYKIIPSAPPKPIPAQYPLSQLDQNDGFVHLSTASQVNLAAALVIPSDAHQVPNTANLFYNDSTALWVVKMELAKLSHPTKWENGFPHLYGNFGADNVVSVEKFEKKEGKTWPGSMQESAWLE